MRSAAGIDIIGTNTMLKGMKSTSFKKGESKLIEWTCPNIFSDGIYYLDPAITYSDGATVCDWWNGAREFRVNKSDTTPYIVTPNFEVKMKVK